MSKQIISNYTSFVKSILKIPPSHIETNKTFNVLYYQSLCKAKIKYNSFVDLFSTTHILNKYFIPSTEKKDRTHPQLQLCSSP